MVPALKYVSRGLGNQKRILLGDEIPGRSFRSDGAALNEQANRQFVPPGQAGGGGRASAEKQRHMLIAA